MLSRNVEILLGINGAHTELGVLFVGVISKPRFTLGDRVLLGQILHLCNLLLLLPQPHCSYNV